MPNTNERDALMLLIEQYAEARHKHGGPEYNHISNVARNAVIAALAATAPNAGAPLAGAWTNAMRDIGHAVVSKHGRYRNGILQEMFEAMLAAAPAQQAGAPLPLAPEVPITALHLIEDAAQAHDQCRAVVHMALSLAEVYVARAAIVAADPKAPIEIIGESSAATMEWLGDLLSNMDATEEEDEWLDPIFDAAQARWPVATPPQALPLAPSEAVMVEAVATVVRSSEGLTLDWLIEGGIAAMVEGQVLLISGGASLTDDTGSGEVFIHAPPQVTLPAEPLQELHDLLYLAQRTTGEPQAKAIGAARLVLHKLRATLPASEAVGYINPSAHEGGRNWMSKTPTQFYRVPVYTRAQPQADAAEPVATASCPRHPKGVISNMDGSRYCGYCDWRAQAPGAQGGK